MKKDVSQIKKTNLSNYEKELKLRENLLNSNLFTLEESRNEYILSLDPLIKKHAKDFVSKGNGKITFEDYVQEAYARVIEKFDTFKFKSSDIRLSTYMNYQIIDAMQTLKVKFEPACSCTTSNVKMLSVIKKYMNENPKASFQMIADYFNISVARLVGILDGEKRSVSAHQPSSDDEKRTLLDTFESRAKTSEEITFLKHGRKELNELLKNVLTEEELSVIERVFGLNDVAKENLIKIADSKKCSKENIRQIKVRAIKKINQSKLKDEICSLLSRIIQISSLKTS